MSKDSQTVDIHKTNKQEAADRGKTDTVIENGYTVSQEGAKAEICKITKTENGEKNEVLDVFMNPFPHYQSKN